MVAVQDFSMGVWSGFDVFEPKQYPNCGNSDCKAIEKYDT
jgi:hypothetical protein